MEVSEEVFLDCSEPNPDGTFDRPIPVVVHELEYYDAIAQQNIEANGPELASGLVDWISSMYDDTGDDLQRQNCRSARWTRRRRSVILRW
ncbi:MAG: hypothetical protein WCC60_16970 [Ilumatobacteraceae bacterium]